MISNFLILGFLKNCRAHNYVAHLSLILVSMIKTGIDLWLFKVESKRVLSGIIITVYFTMLDWAFYIWPLNNLLYISDLNVINITWRFVHVSKFLFQFEMCRKRRSNKTMKVTMKGKLFFTSKHFQQT